MLIILQWALYNLLKYQHSKQYKQMGGLLVTVEASNIWSDSRYEELN